MSLPKQLTLIAWQPKLEGCGSELELAFDAMQETKAKRTHRTRLVLKIDRHVIRRLAEQVQEMQVRDRQRIERELERLEVEVAPLVKP